MKMTDNFDSIELSDPIFRDTKYFISGKVPEKVRNEIFMTASMFAWACVVSYVYCRLLRC
jgi:hypothetical protein